MAEPGAGQNKYGTLPLALLRRPAGMVLRESSAVSILSLQTLTESSRALVISSHHKAVFVWLARVMVVLALADQDFLAAPPPPPREPPPREHSPELGGMKSEFRANLIAAVLPEMKAHREELLALEKKLAAAQDFAGAIKARDERVGTEKQITALEQEAAILASRSAANKAGRPSDRIELKPSEAKLENARLDAADGALVDWGQPNARASWQLPALAPGGYEVMLRCTGGGGDITVNEGFYTLKQACKPSEDKSAEQNLGTLRIRVGAASLSLAPLQPEKSAGWRVYSIVLVPSNH